MSEDDTKTTEHDNSFLRPYLACIANAGDEGLDKSESDELFRGVAATVDPDGEWIGASKVRQTMYIAKLAIGKGSRIFLTDAGRAFLEEGDASER